MGHSTGLLLLTAVAGYWLLERASYQKKGDLRRVGKVVGWFIIVVSVVGVACKVWCVAASSMGMCSFPGKKGGYCPFSRQMPSAPSENR